MSTILDALKKSERERTVVRGLGFSDAGWRPARDVDWPRWVVMGGIAAIGLLVVAVVVVRSGIATPKAVDAPTVEIKTPPVLNATPDAPPPADDVVSPANGSPPLAETASPAFTPSARTELLGSLPPEFQKSVPPMTVNIHVYAPEESQRILYVNNRQYRHGDEMPGGVRVEEIIPEGVVLRFRGQRFRLDKPS